MKIGNKRLIEQLQQHTHPGDNHEQLPCFSPDSCIYSLAAKQLQFYEDAIGAPENACFSGREDDEAARIEWLRGHWKNALDHWRLWKEFALAAGGVLDRALAPCPQCHTLGDDPNCPTMSHIIRRDYQNFEVEARRVLKLKPWQLSDKVDCVGEKS